MLESLSSSRQISLNQWLLTTTTVTDETKLFTSVDVNPNNIYYFCTDRAYKEEAIDYREVLADNTSDVVFGFKEILRGNMLINEADKPPDVEEDHLRNCWKSPPLSVYSKFTSSESASSATQESTLSGITDYHITGTGGGKAILGESKLLQHTNRQLEELKVAAKEQKAALEKEAKAQAKEREDAEQEILKALGLLQNTAKPSQPKEDNVTSEIQ
eukprot:2935447-Ditylum_brightwellii.AAC.1